MRSSACFLVARDPLELRGVAGIVIESLRIFLLISPRDFVVSAIGDRTALGFQGWIPARRQALAIF